MNENTAEREVKDVPVEDQIPMVSVPAATMIRVMGLLLNMTAANSYILLREIEEHTGLNVMVKNQ